MPPSTAETFTHPETHLTDYWDILQRRKWIIILFCLLCTLAVGVFSFFTTPLYRASATLVVEGEGSDVLNPSSSGEVGMSFDIFENYLQTQMSLILSRGVAGKVFEELSLKSDLRYQNASHPFVRYIDKKIDEALTFVGLRENKEGGAVIGDSFYTFLKDIQLERLKGTRAIKIYALHPNAEMAARITNALAEKYSGDNHMRRAMTFIRNQRMASLNADYLRLQSRYDLLSNQYGPKHYEMIKLRDEIRALASHIEIEKSKNAKGEPEKVVGEEQKLLTDILSKIQESSVVSNSQMDNVSIAERAVVPTQVSVPQKKRNTMIAFLASLVMGIFLAFFIEYLDDTIKNEAVLKKVIGGANYLGAIPFDSHSKGFRRISRIDSLVAQRPLSGSAEAYRLLRIQLNWFIKKKPGFKDFAFVSSIPDEGKSTISANMALALSQVNQKVLLVDADIRRGRVSRTFSPGKNKKGLSHYLSDDIALDEAIQPTKIPNLWIISPGDNGIRGSELLSSPKMSEFIQATRAIFDVIVYDTPPITLIADTAVLLSQLHGAILVARTGVTKSRLISKSLNLIHDTNTDLIGVVLNSTSAVDNKYYHRYYKD